MNYLRQLAIIGGISFLGEALNRLLPLPIPGSIYGLVILLLCLITKAIKLESVKSVGHFLIGIMPIMFIGPTVGLMASYEDYRSFLVPFVIISMLSTVIVMAVTGRTAQSILRASGKKRAGAKERPTGPAADSMQKEWDADE